MAERVPGGFHETHLPGSEAVMLTVVKQAASHAPERQLRAFRGKIEMFHAFGRFTAQVQDTNIRQITDDITCALNAAAKVYLFVIEIERLIEVADPFEHVATDAEIGTGDPVHIRRNVEVGPSAVGLTEKAGLRVFRGESREDQEVAQD